MQAQAPGRLKTAAQSTAGEQADFSVSAVATNITDEIVHNTFAL
jgi:hypothetical protein